VAHYKQQRSAGGVVVKRAGDRIDTVLIKPHDRDRWQLPKGVIDKGEDAEATAVREVREEAGVDASVVMPLHPITFFYQMQGQRFVKTVEFFLMEYQSGSPDHHDFEVDEARWFPVQEALECLTFESEQKVLREALGRLAHSSLSTTS